MAGVYRFRASFLFLFKIQGETQKSCDTRAQYACVAAGWSTQTQSLEVDVKSADSVEELMRLAAPCPSQAHALAYPCAAGINTSSVLVFAENAMLDAMVAQASAGAVRALPYGIFAALVSRDTFSRNAVGITGDGADDSGFSHDSAAYHLYNQQMFTDPDLQLEPLTWPSVLTTSEQHATWLVHAAVDAWLSVVPFPHLAQAQAVVLSRSSASFSPDVSNALDHSGRMCTLAALLLDHAQHVKSKDDLSYVELAWRFVDHAAVCLFAVRTFHIRHPSHDRIRANFQQTLWNALQLDRFSLPEPAGCAKCVWAKECAFHRRSHILQLRGDCWQAFGGRVRQPSGLLDAPELDG